MGNRPATAFGRTRIAAWTVLLLLALLPLRVMADRPTYALDEDPIRLGEKALEQGRLADARVSFLEAVAHDYQVPRAKYGLAQVAVREGRYDDAEPLFREALARKQQEDKADYPEARAGLGLLLLRYGRDQEAAQEFDKALQGDSRLWQARYGQARLLLAQQHWEEAKKLLDQGAQLKGAAEGEDEYHFGMALYWLGKNSLPEAEKEALLALHLNAWDPDYGTLVGRVYEKRNAPTLAIDAFEKALQSPGMIPSAPMLCSLGALYQKVGRYNEARDRYLRAVAVDSTYAPALKDLADLFRLAKQYDRAARTYLRYITLEHDDVEALLGLAESCIEIRQYEQAVEAARAAMALDDSRTDVRLAFARSGIRSREIATRAEAARVYANLPAGTDLQAQDYVALADYQTETKQYPQARQSLDRALALDPQQANAYFQQGVIDLEMGQPQAAITHLEKAIDLKSDSPVYYLDLGIANFQAQRLGQAIPAFRHALRLNEGLTVGRLLLAQALAVSDSLAGAEVQYQKVLDAEPQNAKALRGLGFCHIRRADYREALRIYQAATAADPQNADGWAGLGNAYLGLENWDAAETAFGKAAAIDPGNITMRKGRELLNRARQEAANDG